MVALFFSLVAGEGRWRVEGVQEPWQTVVRCREYHSEILEAEEFEAREEERAEVSNWRVLASGGGRGGQMGTYGCDCRVLVGVGGYAPDDAEDGEQDSEAREEGGYDQGV